MKKYQIIFITTLTASLTLMVGCTTQTTTNDNTNQVVNTNVTNENTNVVVANANENTNSEQGSEVDISDWLTYTNDEYEFSFKYPKEWGSVEMQSVDEVSLLFSNRENVTDQYLITPIISVAKEGSEGDSANLPPFDYQKIDFSKSETELSEDLKRSGATSDVVTKMKIDSKDAVQIVEATSGLTGKQIYTTFLIIPNFLDESGHFTVTINGILTNELSTFISTITF